VRSADRGPSHPLRGARALRLALGLLCAQSAPAAADSIFSALGVGEVVTTADMRGRGMGNVSVGIYDPWNVGRGNPATLASVRAYFVHGELFQEARSIDADTGDHASPTSTNLPQIRAGLAVPKVGVVALGLAEYTSVSYELEEVTGAGTGAIRRTLSGKNGLDVLTLTFARRVRPRIMLGADLDFMLGSFQDVWKTDFLDPNAFDTIDSLVVEHSIGPALRLGILGRPYPHVDLGGAITFGRSLELRPKIKHEAGEATDLPRYDLDLPLTIALGVSGDLTSRWRGAMDFTYANWSGTDLTLGTDPILNRQYVPTGDLTKIGVGVEYQMDRAGESRRYHHHIPLRAGFAWEPWPILDVHGEKIHDKFITAGAGFPVGDEVGMIQLAFQYGWRGNREVNDLEEQVYRLGIGFTAREKVAVEKGRK
jgi:hypothetical protein